MDIIYIFVIVKKELGFSTMFQFAVYEKLRSIRKDEAVSKDTTKL
jgi:hypothetical protein